MKYLIEGLDRLGKDTLIQGILNTRGYHQVVHFSKPQVLAAYDTCPDPLQEYQYRSFKNLFRCLESAKFYHLICNRAHLGEVVYSPLYRGYSGEYVFQLERDHLAHQWYDTRLILLTENFKVSRHFVDDGLSFDVSKRQKEQELFLSAFESSAIKDKRIICVTAEDGTFRAAADILADAVKD